MTISTTTSRITYSGNGVTDEFAFPYYFFENGDLIVILTDSDGVSTVQTITSDYTVTGAGNDSGGTVTMLTPPAAGESLLIYRSLSLTQETDYITGDPFPAETHERALDRLTMIAQQLQEELNRSAKLPVTSVADAESLVADIITLANIAGDISDVAVIYAQVSTVAGISGNVTTVATNIADVTTVAGNTSNINAVVASQTNINTVAGIASDVTTVAANVTDVTNFSDVYQGPKTSDPATRNDGSALQAGDLYFNTVSGRMRVYSGSVWADTAPTATSITSTQISDSTTTGRAVLTAADAAAARTAIGAQETLVSGTNIKTVNGGSLLGSGNLSLFSAPGAAPAYVCRAWVNFNGTGTVAIRASGNVSSITDNGVGDYTVNFTTAMPDANYCVAGSCCIGSSLSNSGGILSEAASGANTFALKTVSAVRVVTSDNNTDSLFDAFTANVAIFR